MVLDYINQNTEAKKSLLELFLSKVFTSSVLEYPTSSLEVPSTNILWESQVRMELELKANAIAVQSVHKYVYFQ